jgi:2'-5' RNA ligase
MKQTARTFVAIEIDDAVRRRAGELIDRLAAGTSDVRWVETHNLHLTLKFLGEVPLNEIPRVCEAVERGAAEVTPFTLQLYGAGAFPHPGRPRTLWLGAGEGEASAVALYEAVDRRLRKLGFRSEKRQFKPHLTIGRVRRSGPGLQQLGDHLREQAQFDAGTCPVQQATVFSSELTPDGPIYTPLARTELGG